MKKKNNDPFEDCANCKDLTDCKHPDFDDENGLNLPMIPDCCPRPITIMNATVKKQRVTHKLMREN